ncbi:hypothetical protein FGG90_15565 (plasmid) [Clavibacter tessellarius]|uniref:Lipoprotein n=1 Tax=Clavibacter tessellarius TaxID=31965 RepID=A0A225CJ38_9MICO|nr:hypothetical protein [Clavibacter michiganensis]OQJ61404.1 hypothetical protein B5P24_15410 [Clavibacter michiganensis subsp. tessellarius]OQJ61450.1 hypothetical protein B5P24_15650 [Clavibacter michiganensis subsp. tessellarius]UKF35496.1 hypothetical protein FGG90_15565 [Clavibacter michiganensis subsp. tessellarius]
MLMKQGWAIGIAVALGFALSSCSSTPEAGPVYSELKTDVNDMAIAAGTLTTEGECLTLSDGTIPIFPKATTEWKSSVLTYSGAEYKVGDEIELTGGEVPRDGDLGKTVPANCGDGALFAAN